MENQEEIKKGMTYPLLKWKSPPPPQKKKKKFADFVYTYHLGVKRNDHKSSKAHSFKARINPWKLG